MLTNGYKYLKIFINGTFAYMRVSSHAMTTFRTLIDILKIILEP